MGNKIKSYTCLHLAVLMGLAGYMSLSIHLDWMKNLFLPTLILLLVLYITFFAVKYIMGEVDILFSLVTFKVVIGWLILVRLQPQLASRHLLWIALGCLLLIIFLKTLHIFPNDFILKHKFYWLVLTLFLLFIPLVFGIRVGGAKSWLDIYGFRFQPSEAAKLSYLVFLASWFKDKASGAWQNSWPAWLGTMGCIALLVIQRDLGTALIFYLAFLFILYLTSGKLEYSLQGIVLLIFGSIIAYFSFTHVQIRAISWLNPWLEPEGSGYQIIQSLFALASGGIAGMGLGGGFPNNIPEAHTDFVFAVIGEQLGLLGTTGVVLLYLFFAFFSLKRAQFISTFGSRLLATGLTCVLIVQAFVIMGGVTKLIPLTGLPLPFMGYGGSSTISSFVMLGIIIWLGREKGFVSSMSRNRLINISKLIWFIFLLLILNLGYWQVIKAQNLIKHPFNARSRLVENFTTKGVIYAANGSLLAGNNDKDNTRYYPLKEAAAHIIGYDSPKYGKTGLENSLNSFLYAKTLLKPGFIDKKRAGWNVYTTINPELQKIAWLLHREKAGASVVIEVKTGNILALVSSPSYDPNSLLKDWGKYTENSSGVFLNRATQGLYPPGSVFKIISGTALLQLKPEVARELTFIEPQIDAGGYVIKDMLYRSNLTFQEALGYSSNLFFVKHFLDLSWEDVAQELQNSFMISNDFSSKEIPLAKAQLGQVIDQVDVAFTVIGQGEVVVTPVHIAIWTCAIANDGLILQPNIIDRIVDQQGIVIEKKKPTVLGRACSEENAQLVLEGLKYSVQFGTGKNAKIPEITLGGKTGTAENIHGDPHAWFVGIGPLEDPKIVVVTIVENGGRGGDTALPIAKRLIEGALR